MSVQERTPDDYAFCIMAKPVYFSLSYNEKIHTLDLQSQRPENSGSFILSWTFQARDKNFLQYT